MKSYLLVVSSNSESNRFLDYLLILAKSPKFR